MSVAGQQYQATAFHAEAEAAGVDGVIQVEAQRLVFKAAEAQWSIPLDHLVIERAPDGGVALTDVEQPGWTLLTSNDDILRDYFFQTRNRLRLQVRELRRSREGARNLRLALGFLIAGGVLVALVWGLTNWTIRFLVSGVPVSWEAELSADALEEMREHLTVIEQPQWPESFHLSTNRLLAHLPRTPYQFEFLLVSNREPNALALPAGRILVFSGLFEFADQPEQIAGVLAHEMAHVTHRHGLRQLIVSAGPYYVLRLFISDQRGFGALVRNGSLLLVQQDYSREQEREADVAAWHHLVTARIDPRGLTTFFEKLANNPLEQLLNASGLRLLQSHPPTSERIEQLRRLERNQGTRIEFAPLTKVMVP